MVALFFLALWILHAAGMYSGESSPWAPFLGVLAFVHCFLWDIMILRKLDTIVTSIRGVRAPIIDVRKSISYYNDVLEQINKELRHIHRRAPLE